MLDWLGGRFDPEAFNPAMVKFDDPKKTLEEGLPGRIARLAEASPTRRAQVSSFTIGPKRNRLRTLGHGANLDRISSQSSERCSRQQSLCVEKQARARPEELGAQAAARLPEVEAPGGVISGDLPCRAHFEPDRRIRRRTPAPCPLDSPQLANTVSS